MDHKNASSKAGEFPSGFQLLSIADRRDVLEGLALSGSDAAAHDMILQLTKDYYSKPLPFEECAVLDRMIFCLGYISSRSDVAAKFLLDSTDPESWNTNQLWRDDRFEALDRFKRHLAGYSLAALGVGGRREIREEIRRIQGREMSPEVAEDWGAAFLEAMFTEYLGKKLGLEGAHQLELSASGVSDAFQEWKINNETDPIIQWYEDKRKSPKP